MRELLKQAFTIIFARGFIRIAQLLSFVVLARLLTPSEFGYFGIITSSIALAVAVGSLGLWQAVAYEIGQKRLSRGDAVATILALTPILAGLSAIFVHLLVGSDIPGMPALPLIIACGISGSMFVLMSQGIFLGSGEIGRYGLMETLPRVVMALIVVVLASASLITLQAALWAFAGSFAVIVPVAIIFILKGAKSLRPRIKGLPKMLGYGLAFASKVFLVTLNLRLGMFMLEHLAGAESAGHFFAASRVNEIFLEAAAAFGLVLFSQGVRKDAASAVMHQNSRIACWMLWLFVLGGGAVVFLAPLLVSILMGPGYEAATPMLQILAMSLGPAAATKVLSPAMSGQGKAWLGTIAMLPSVMVNLCLAWVLIDSFGPIGAAIALTVSQFLAFGTYAILIKAHFSVKFVDQVLPTKADAIGLVAAMKRFARIKQ